MKKVSILLSCFNGTDLIEGYIDSLLHPEICSIATLVAIDFPFSHRDSDFVERQLRRYPDLVLVKKEENVSLYEAWNEAIRISPTEFVGNLNLDDRVSPDYYRSAVSALEKFSGDVFSSFSIMTSEIGQISPDARTQAHIPVERFKGEEIVEYGIDDLVMIANGRIVKKNIPHCAPVWRKSLHTELGYFDSKKYDFCADYEFWLRVAAKKKKMLVSRLESTVFYCSTGTVSDRLIHPESQKILDRWRETFPPANYKPTHLGEAHDLLHHCLNMNAIFGLPEYYAHLGDPSAVSEKLLSVINADGPAGSKPINMERLRQFKDKHKGEKALLLCNGPSLKKVDFSRIDPNEFTIFGLNKIFLGFESLGVEPNYIVAINKKVIEQSAEEYNCLQTIKFISNRVDPLLVPESTSTYHMNTANLPKPHNRFSQDISEYVYEGWTVTHAALQIIFYMGFSEVFIVGMDHRFSQHVMGQENKEAVIKGADLDHFDPRYFGNGQSWDLPDLVNSEISYRAALEAFNKDGRYVFDCTIDGACKIFPKSPVWSLYENGRESQTKKTLQIISQNVSKPLISIIIPLFNAVRFIGQAVDSIFEQDVSNIEIIIIDDASIDGSFELVNQLAKHESRIRIHKNQRTKGVSGARNTGLDLASGDYIGFLDADDFFESGAFKARLEVLTMNPEQPLVHSCLRFVGVDGNDLGFSVGKKNEISFHDTSGNPANFNSIFARSGFIKKFRFKEGLGNGEDWLFLATLLRSGAKSKYVEGGGAVYRLHPSSETVSNFYNHEDMLKHVLDWIYSDSHEAAVAKEFTKGLRTPPKEEVLLRRETNVFLWALLAGDDKKCRALLADPKFARFLETLTKDHFLSSMRLIIARQHMVSLEAASNLPEAIISKIRNTSDSIGLALQYPALDDALAECFGYKCAINVAVNQLDRDSCNGDNRQEDGRHIISPNNDKIPLSFNFKGLINSGDFVAGIMGFRIDKECTLSLMLVGDGNTTFESAVENFSLPKGQHILAICHQFNMRQDGVSLKVSAVDSSVTITDIKCELEFLSTN